MLQNPLPHLSEARKGGEAVPLCGTGDAVGQHVISAAGLCVGGVVVEDVEVVVDQKLHLHQRAVIGLIPDQKHIDAGHPDAVAGDLVGQDVAVALHVALSVAGAHRVIVAGVDIALEAVRTGQHVVLREDAHRHWRIAVTGGLIVEDAERE